MTNEEIENKRHELETKLGCEVHAFVFTDPKTNEIYTGFLQEPDRITKMQCIDMALQSWTLGAKQILDTCILKEESHPYTWEEFYGRDSKRDAVYLGALQFSQTLIRRYTDTFKKK